MNGIIFTPGENKPGKRDFTHAFRPEARSCARFLCIPKENIFSIPKQPRREMREQVVEALSEPGWGQLWEHVLFFCHGYPSGIQLGFRNSDIDELAEAIADHSEEDVVVTLYCCSTARSRQRRSIGGDGGFADLLRDALCRYGCRRTKVIAHVTAGHTTRNPHIRFFYGNGSTVGGTGGMYVVDPKGPLWRQWGRWLRQGNNRFAFPTMERDGIVENVCAA